jgi:hypothetical protein
MTGTILGRSGRYGEPKFGRFDRNLTPGCGFKIAVSHRHRTATAGRALRFTDSAASVFPIGI